MNEIDSILILAAVSALASLAHFFKSIISFRSMCTTDGLVIEFAKNIVDREHRESITIV
jgi:hypothetical protein